MKLKNFINLLVGLVKAATALRINKDIEIRTQSLREAVSSENVLCVVRLENIKPLDFVSRVIVSTFIMGNTLISLNIKPLREINISALAVT